MSLDADAASREAAEAAARRAAEQRAREAAEQRAREAAEQRAREAADRARQEALSRARQATPQLAPRPSTPTLRLAPDGLTDGADLRHALATAGSNQATAPRPSPQGKTFTPAELARAVSASRADGLDRLGLTKADLQPLGTPLPAGLLDAGQKARQGDWKGAITAAADLAKQHPEVVAKVIQAGASQLPDGVAKAVLSDPTTAQLLAKAGPDVIKKALDDPFKAVLKVAGNKQLREAAIDAALTDPHFAATVKSLGLDATALRGAGDALPNVLQAAQAADAGDWHGAALELAQAAKDAPALVQKGLAAIGQQLPDGVAKALLTDPDSLAALAKAGPAALKQALTEGPEAALRSFTGSKGVRDALLSAAMKDEGFAKQVAAFGLDLKDLQQLGDGLPKLLDGLDAARAGDWKGALGDVLDAAKKAPDVLAKAVRAGAAKLPDGLAKTVLGDAAFSKELAKASPDALKALLDGRLGDGLAALGTDKKLRDAALDAALKDPGFAAQAKALGLDADALHRSGDAAVSLVRAGEALAAQPPDAQAALGHLADAAAKVPDLAARGIQAAAAKLPDGLAKTVLTDPKASLQLARTAPAVLRALAKGDVGQALGALAGKDALRDAVIDAAFQDPGFAGQMKGLGLSKRDLKEGGDALEHAWAAGQALARHDLEGAVGELAAAAKSAPDLVHKALTGLADSLPPGLGRELLRDPAVSTAIVSDPDTGRALQAIVDGRPLEGLSTLLGNDKARGAILAVVAKDPGAQEALKKVGLTTDDLAQAGAAAPHVLSAMQHLADGQLQPALDELGQAADAAPALLAKVGTAIYERLPASVRATLDKLGLTRADVGQAAKALPDLVDAAKAIGAGDWKGALDATLRGAEQAPDLGQKLVTKLGEALPDSLGLGKRLLTDPAVARAVASDPNLHAGLRAALDGKPLEAASTLLHDDQARDAVLSVVAKDPTVQGALGKLGLTSQDLLEAGAAAPHVFDAVQKLAASPADWQGAVDALGQAASAAPDLVKKLGHAIYEKLPAGVRRSLDALGLDGRDFEEAGLALPHLIDAAQRLAAGKPSDALTALGQAVDAAPDLVAKAVGAVAQKLPDGLAKTMLTDPKTVRDFFTDPGLRGAAQKLLAGDATGALHDAAKALGPGSALLTDVAGDVMKDPQLAAKLGQLGITSVDDLVKLGATVGDAFSLVDDLAHQDWGAAVKDLGTVVKDLPQGLRDTVLAKLGDALHLPPELREVLGGVVDALGDPEVRTAVADAFASFKSGNPAEWIQGLAKAGEVISKDDPQLAVGFLDTLSHLPGSVGAFFSDHTLNQDLVQSGSLTHLFGAVEKLAQGDVPGALGELGNSFGSLITAGKHFSIAGKELPIGEEGLDAVGRLMKQFVAAMPPKVKAFLEEKIASVVAKGGFHSIPLLGPAIGLVDDGVELAQDFSQHKSGLDTALDAASLVVDGASLFPPFQAAATPLKVILGVGEAVTDTVEFVDGIKDFGQQFTGMAA